MTWSDTSSSDTQCRQCVGGRAAMQRWHCCCCCISGGAMMQAYQQVRSLLGAVWQQHVVGGREARRATSCWAKWRPAAFEARLRSTHHAVELHVKHHGDAHAMSRLPVLGQHSPAWGLLLLLGRTAPPRCSRCCHLTARLRLVPAGCMYRLHIPTAQPASAATTPSALPAAAQ